MSEKIVQDELMKALMSPDQYVEWKRQQDASRDFWRTLQGPVQRPIGSNADEWNLFLTDHKEGSAAYFAVQIAEAIEEAERRGYAIGAHRQALANSDWQPIETAPVGRRVDLWLVGDQAEIEFYCPGNANPSGSHHWAGRATDMVFTHGAWRPWCGLEKLVALPETISVVAWMPVPAAPTPTTTKERQG